LFSYYKVLLGFDYKIIKLIIYNLIVVSFL
jgi:hypothetical protein